MKSPGPGLDWKKWRVMAGLYLVTNLAFVIQRVTFDLQRGMPLEIISSLLDLAGFAGIWITLAIGILRLTAGRPLTPGNIALYFVAGIVLSLVHGVLYILFSMSMPGLMTTGQILTADDFLATLAGLGHAWRFLSFGFLVVVSHAYDYHTLSIEREKRAVQLEVQLTEAKLNALKMQMHPHFLFNTLNAITVLIDENPAAAKTTLSQLSDLLRLALDNVRTQEVPLRREMEFLDNYLLIQKTRYGERLSVIRNIEGGTLDAAVPYLMLQPVVENALKYGIDALPGPGTITISAYRENGRLVLRVDNSGPGKNQGRGQGRDAVPGPTPGLGLGLSNTGARLQQLYGENQSVAISVAGEGGGGTSVTLTIPYKQAGDAPAAGVAG